MNYLAFVTLLAFIVSSTNAFHRLRPRPDIKLYDGPDVGRVICFHHSSLSETSTIPVGFLEIQGEYVNSIFQPHGYEGQDISSIQYFKDLCNNNISDCQGQCWAGGALKVVYPNEQ